MTYKTDTADLIKTIITRLKNASEGMIGFHGSVETLTELANNLDPANRIQVY